MTVLQFVPNTLEHLLLVLLVGLPLFLTGSAFFISLGRSVGVAIAPATEGRSSALYAMIIHLFFVFLVWTTQPLIPKRQYDADLAENFRRHEAEFRQLALMADEDKYTMIIGEDTANVRSGTLSLDRLAQYRRLFGAVGMQGPMRSEGGGGLVTFSSRIEGIFEGTDRGYAHARNTRKPLVDSIDYIPFKSPSNQPVYRKLTEDWYLYYERDY
ncbi:MAG: hypothetical protein NTZ05_18795 [Chloroflexi bacterium]|nr:hypothetical protein [Chloroflexota bacterium]